MCIIGILRDEKVTMKIERTKNTVRNMFWGYISKMIGILLPFVFRTVIIKLLGAEYLGINSLFNSILQVLNLTELGFGTAVVYSMYKPIAENNEEEICALLKYYKKVYVLVGIFVLSLGTLLLPVIPYLIFGHYPDEINLYFVFYMFLINTAISYFLFGYRSSLLNAFQRNDLESKVEIIVSLFRYTFEIIGIYVTKKYYLFLGLEIIFTIFSNFLKYVYAKKYFPEYNPIGSLDYKQKREIRDNVFALMCHKIGGTVLNSADNIVLSSFMGVVIVSNYGNYYYIMNAVEKIIMICFVGMTAGIGNSFLTETVEKNRDDFKKVLFMNAWIVGWCSVCFVCLYQDFMKLWVGEEYMLNNQIMLLIVFYFFIHGIRRTIIVFRDGAGMWQDNKWQPILSAIFNILVNIILVQVIGLAGILISSIASMIIIDIPWESHAFCKRIEMNGLEYLKALIIYFIVTAMTTSIVVASTYSFDFSLIINLILKSCFCIVIPNIIFWTIYRKKAEYLYFQSLIKGYLKSMMHS